jgi:hypothetical protein
MVKMEPVILTAIILFGVFAGALGAMLGLGGGILMIIFFILALNLPLHTAVALSLIAVIASSSMAGSVYTRDKLTNIKLSIVLETCSVTGAIVGTVLALFLPAVFTEAVLVVVLFYASFMMFRAPISELAVEPAEGRRSLKGEFYDAIKKQLIKYSPIRVKLGMVTSVVAGAISGIVGIGGGVVMVPIMNLIMKVPMRASAATSNFMVGVTAAASALLYFNEGFVDLNVAVPTVVGIMVGAYIGTRLMVRVRTVQLKRLLGAVLAFFAVVLMLRALGVLTF